MSIENYFNPTTRLLSKVEILNLLHEMDRKIGNFSDHIEINIYGGAVMCLNYGNRCSTQDIDSTFKDLDIIYPLVKSMAEEHGLPLDWFNNAVEDIKSVLLKEELNEVVGFENLVIRFPSSKQMLAMKLYSARLFPKSDLDDAVTLCIHLGITTKTAAEKILREFIDHEVIINSKLSFLELVIKEVHKRAQPNDSL